MSTTPTVTFNRYTADGVPVDISSDVYTIASGTMSGVYADEDKFIYGVAVSPMGSTTNTPVVHEFVFDIDPQGGVELSTMSPMAGSSGVNTRYINVTNDVVDVTAWGIGVTSGVLTLDVTGGESGSPHYFSNTDFPLNSGATWSAQFGSSGSAHMDVPTLYNGSFVVLNDATAFAWDKAQYLHDFQIVSAQVGHEVALTSGTGVESGTIVDDQIDLWRSGAMMINVKTYHEVPHKWELVDPDDLVTQSGVQVHTINQWLYIDDLDLLDPAINETWQLKLYGSGSLKYPTPLRTISINIYVANTSGRFGIGRFGTGRFGIE